MAAHGETLKPSYRSYIQRLKGQDALDSKLACESGQACIFFFGMQNIIFTFIHSHQLFMDTRFVNAPDKPEPHDSRRLRWVRVIDAFVSLTLSIFLAGLSYGLRNKQITGTSARNLLLGFFSIAVCVYVAGTFVDFAQCYFQAGGIGTHCHGYHCLQISVALALTTLVGEYKPQFFCAVCFGGHGLYRLWWALREERSMFVTATVSTISIMLLLFPAFLYVEEIIDWQMGNSKKDSRDDARPTGTV